jgi:hypothetical protein
MTTVNAFEKNLSFFKERQNTPWSRLRYNIIFANLKRHTSKALTTLDAGGSPNKRAE